MQLVERTNAIRSRLLALDGLPWIEGNRVRLRAPGDVISKPRARLTSGCSWPRAAWNVGEGRHAVEASQWPLARRGEGLQRFLRFEPEPLSVKATAGFLQRAERSSLRFPVGFLDTVREHLAQMRSV